MLEDPEKGFLALEVYVHCGGKEEWGVLAKNIKGDMNRKGFEDLAGRVVMVCIEGLHELLS